MPDISITADVAKPVDPVKVDLTQPSSLVDYAKSLVLHLLVAPDFVERKDQVLTQAAKVPIRFQAKLGNSFELGKQQPEITLTPKVNAVLRANTTAGAALFADDPFHQSAQIPTGIGYLGIALTGALDLGVSGSAGDLTFGLDAGASVAIEFLKAFATGADQPTLGDAAAQVLAGYLIPASVGDLKRLQVNDICTVSGQGSLEISGGFQVATPVNPLASVNLPVNAGTLDVKSGAIAGVSASFTLSGSYQIRARRQADGAVELSYLRERGTRLQADFKAAASLSATFNSTDLLATLLGAIGKSAIDPKLLDGLTPEEIKTFSAAVREGLSHSVQASIDLVLATETDDQATFQYELDLDALDDAGTAAVNRALHGDLTLLTALEKQAAAGERIAPGIKLRNSLLERTRTRGITLKVNLLGIVNLLSLSRLISNCEILTEPASGDVTIKETAKSERISAISDPYQRQEALRKALFEAVLVTTTYRAGKAVQLPELDCHCLHFVLNRNTAPANVRNYLNWFAALGLIAPSEAAALLAQYPGDKTSTCVLRAAFDDAACEGLFFDFDKLREYSYYLEFGRQALRAMLAASADDVTRARYRVLDDDALWKRAIDTGPNAGLRELIPMDHSDARINNAVPLVSGDVYDIVWWAQSMCDAGKSVNAMRQYLAGRDSAALAEDAGFIRLRDALQKTMLKVVANSKARFDQPWGMVSLLWAAGSPAAASGKLAAGSFTVIRP